MQALSHYANSPELTVNGKEAEENTHGNPEHSPRSHNVRQGHAAVETARHVGQQPT
jgi:hypothetical protein